MLYELFLKATELVEALGYLGIFIMSFIEGTFIPIPSEITLIPAGYLVAKGSLKMSYVLISGISGTLGGAIFSYTIAFHFGRAIFIKYGKYFFMDEKKLSKLEDFMAKYGNISVFLGRVLPGIKHFISFPAGLGKMDPKLFCFYSTCGSGVEGKQGSWRTGHMTSPTLPQPPPTIPTLPQPRPQPSPPCPNHAPNHPHPAPTTPPTIPTLPQPPPTILPHPPRPRPFPPLPLLLANHGLGQAH